MVEVIEIIAYIIIGVIGIVFGAVVSRIVSRLQQMKASRNFDHEKVFESLTKDGKVYYDQPETNGPARKMIFSLKEDPKTGKKILHQDFEDYVPPKEEKKKAPKKTKGKPKKPVAIPSTSMKKEAPKAPNYNKMFGGKK